MGKKVYFPVSKLGLRHWLFFFEYFGGYFVSIKRTVAKIYVKKFSLQAMKPVLGHLPFFLELFVVILRGSDLPFERYGRKHLFLVLKPILGHSPQFFEDFGGYFE